MRNDITAHTEAIDEILNTPKLARCSIKLLTSVYYYWPTDEHWVNGITTNKHCIVCSAITIIWQEPKLAQKYQKMRKKQANK